MIPVTPSHRRPGISYADLHRNLSPSQPATKGFSSLPLPPLYYNNNYPSRNECRAKEAPVVFVSPDKNGNRHVIPRSPNTSFTPIDRPPFHHHSFKAYTPPASPYHQKMVLPSPSPSLMSATSHSETTDAESVTMSPYHMSPSPTYASSLQTAYHHRSSYYDTRSPTPRSPGFVTPTRRSPTKKVRTPGSASSTEDSSRKQRVKTELCMHFATGKICSFGVNCTYAHGEEELQKTKLMDLQRAGLIEDIETYRAKPCLTWVATGSCPFGKRCSGIHDPRIIAPTPSWLPHTETQGNSISTDINVDGLHQKRLLTILHSNPFGDQFSLELDDWADLYKLICNTTASNKRRRNNLFEIHKLSIALQMRGGHDWMYKYRPQHIVYDTLCIVLQKRAFRLDNSGLTFPILINDFNPRNSQHIMVREIAFGPDSDPTVRGVALWFGIPEHEVSQCTPQQAKRYRWRKAAKHDDRPRTNNDRSLVFDSRECFAMIRPHDRDAFELATDILEHRYETVKAERISTLSERSEALKALQKGKELLRETFGHHKRHWTAWAWPINTGRQTIDDDTPVPPIDGEYNPIIDQEAMSDDYGEVEGEKVTGSFIQPIWESFVSHKFEGTRRDPRCKPDEGDWKPSSIADKPRRRLSIFARLGYGESINPDRSSLPHIRHDYVQTSTSSDPLPRQSERCWRALLLKRDNLHAQNEWEIVREHFQNARSKKVLTIIQQ